VVVVADVNPAVQIARDMRRLPDETHKALRPKLREAGEVVAADARQRASWSSRIPGTIRVRTSFRENREGVQVVAGGSVAPHARAYENVANRGTTFRHPFFGNRSVWFEQKERPYLFPAALASEAESTALVRTALDTVAVSLGFD
jgi:hypothetical protein